MTRTLLAGLAAAIALAAPAHAQAPRCHATGTGLFTQPDNARACTPGAFQRLTRKQVCTSKDRPTLTAATRRTVLADYGVPNWTGANGEIDHRVPLFLGGLTTVANLWPEVGSIPNPKDALEFRVFREVCFKDPVFMRVRTARRLFLSQWVWAYGSLVLGRPVG